MDTNAYGLQGMCQERNDVNYQNQNLYALQAAYAGAVAPSQLIFSGDESAYSYRIIAKA